MTESPDTAGRGGVRLRPGARTLSRVTALTTAAVLSTTGVGAAGAQSLDPGSLVPSVAPGSLLGIPSLSVAALTQLGAPVPLTSVLGSISAIGSADFARPGSSAPPSTPIATRDLTISESTVRAVQPLFPASLNPDDARAEVWTVSSKTMQRTVRVEVYRAPAGVNAPNVYFLDGVGSESPSGWSGGMGWGDPALRERQVNVIVPTGAPSSMWSNWLEDDLVLGPNQWETFLNTELPLLLEQGLAGTVGPLAHNGDWGVMGVSMGAASALHLANTNPMFGAAAGVSGAYSTTDELGYQYARLTVAARHGDAATMWGPRGSAEWKRHDTVANPSGLAGKAVYLSAATGLVGSAELGRFGSNEIVLIDGHILEKGSYESTKKLEAALADVDNVDLRTNYMPTGIHNWPVFVTQMLPGMDHVLSGLTEAAPNGRPTTGGLGSGSTGSLGSAGSTGSGASTGSAVPAGSLGSAGS